MSQAVLHALIRHFLNFVGAIMVTMGYMTEESLGSMLSSIETLIGIVLTMGATGWSLLDKTKGY